MVQSDSKEGALYIVWVTAPDEKTAKRLAHDIVSSGLAACVTLLPQAESHYMWQGKIEMEIEVQMLIKTSEVSLRSLISFVENNHPFDVPEVIATKVSNASNRYAEWIRETTTP